MTELRLKRLGLGLLMVAGLAVTGCQSPASVGPLLEASRAATLAEAARLEADEARDGAWVAQTRRMLADAYDTDLQEAEADGRLSADWVSDATVVYAIALEELARHEMRLLAERETRRANLETAAALQARALGLLRQQDALVSGLLGEADGAAGWALVQGMEADDE